MMHTDDTGYGGTGKSCKTVCRGHGGKTAVQLKALLTCLYIGTAGTALADDNLLAHRLFEQGDYVRAAEIFTDPSWKGVALYRSSQWWRAAEAFVRANDADSAYNLGNCYVRLGYYELALDAYQQALALDPAMDDARHNADIMRQLLARDDEQEQRGGRQPTGEAIDQLDTEDQSTDPGSGEGGDEQSESGDSSASPQTRQGEQSLGRQNEASAGKGGQASQQDQPSADENGSDALQGDTTDDDPASRPSGGSEADTPLEDSQAAGLRTTLETEQATEQWLNRIHHDAELFLQRRIQLELQRRQAAGQSAPEGGNSW